MKNRTLEIILGKIESLLIEYNSSMYASETWDEKVESKIRELMSLVCIENLSRTDQKEYAAWISRTGNRTGKGSNVEYWRFPGVKVDREGKVTISFQS